jgi:cysteine desulfuration protein SufE
MFMNVNEVQNRIIEEMSVREDLIDKYQYLVDLAKRLDVPDDGLRIDENLIKGCQSSVWIKAEFKDDKLCLWGDSDSLITKGMVAVLLRIFNDQPPEEILNADLYFLNETGLSAHLSPARSDGLAAIINHIKTTVQKTI